MTKHYCGDCTYIEHIGGGQFRLIQEFAGKQVGAVCVDLKALKESYEFADGVFKKEGE